MTIIDQTMGGLASSLNQQRAQQLHCSLADYARHEGVEEGSVLSIVRGDRGGYVLRRESAAIYPKVIAAGSWDAMLAAGRLMGAP